MDVSTTIIVKLGLVLEFLKLNQDARDLRQIDWNKCRPNNCEEMALQLLFQLMLILVSLETLSPAMAAPTVIAKPNCTDTCGNISLPFPFGIEPGCFLNEWYEIVCIPNGTISHPRLKKLDLEVLTISLPFFKFPYINFGNSAHEGTITVQFPVAYSNSSCGQYNHQQPVTLDKSPLVFSETDNIFLAFGCNFTATLRIPNDTSVIGCMTQCSGGANPKKWFCNLTTIPTGLQSYNVDFVNGDHEDCRFASFVEKTWFEPYVTDLYTLRNRGYVPVVLKWGVLDSFLITSTLGAELDSTNTSNPDKIFECETTSYINQNNTPFMQCCCSGGYTGNPYLQNGCQDINECEDPQLQTGYRCSKELCYNYNGSYYCSPPNYKNSNSNTILTVIGIVVGISLAPLILCVISIIFLHKRMKKRKQIKMMKKLFKEGVDRGITSQQIFSRDGNINIHHGKLFSPKELRRATNNYSKDLILGQGGQGTVYKGTMTDGAIVAVKKSNKQMDDANVKQFINEVVILSLMNHRNIVKLLGVCLETDIPLLVYEFIPNGTLYHYLHNPNDEFQMTWDVRLRIAVELAGAVSYMHSSASIPIYHRDIKSTNILLDENYRAKIADFGTSRSVSVDQTHVTTLVQGTFGYLDPEYFRLSRFTDKSDVYSFGVVLAELLTGQKPIFSLREGEHMNLAAYFLHAMQENRVLEIIDKEVVEQAAKEEVEGVAALIRRCLHVKGRNRPTMRQVASKLESLRGLPLADDHLVNENSHEYSMEEQDYFESEVSCDVTLTSDVSSLKRCPTW